MAEKYQDIPHYNAFLLEELRKREEREEERANPGIKEIKILSILNFSMRRSDNIQELLDILPKICKNVQKIKLFDLYFINPNLLCNVIKQQRRLTSIKLTHGYVDISSALKHYSKSLKTLGLKYINIYHNEKKLFNAFDQLVNLEYLEIN